MKKLKKLLMVVLMVLLMVILSVLLKSIVANAAVREDRLATVEDLLFESPVGVYKYDISVDDLRYNYDNLDCVRRGSSLCYHEALNPNYRPSGNLQHLYKLTCYVEINGENARFYARRRSFYFTRRNFNT